MPPSVAQQAFEPQGPHREADFTPWAVRAVGVTSRWQSVRKVLGCGIVCARVSFAAAMRRRQFIAGLAMATFWPVAARTQQSSGQMRRVGILSPYPELHPPGMRMQAFLDRLRELGWIDGKTIQIHARYAGGVLDRLPGLARELVALKVDVIVSLAVPASVAARAATATIPIVMVEAGNPVGAGLIESLARPGGNVTGLSSMAPELNSKMVELLHQVVPSARRVAYLCNSTNPGVQQGLPIAADAARRLGLELIVVDVVAPQDFEPAFARIEQSQAEALQVPIDPLIFNNRKAVFTFAARRGLPALYGTGNLDLMRDGGLMSYGTNIDVQYPRAADYVDKILKGTSPSELPVEQPTRFKMLVNLKTARALNLELPPNLLAVADEVIE
jgi:putative ABC transport system substrate-binding protein